MSKAESYNPGAGLRRQNLAMHFQESITAIVRLRAGRQPVSDPQWFRTQLRDALKLAAEQARDSGYNSEDVKSAAFAVVAFLDESILNSNNPVFSDWSRRLFRKSYLERILLGKSSSIRLINCFHGPIRKNSLTCWRCINSLYCLASADVIVSATRANCTPFCRESPDALPDRGPCPDFLRADC